MQENLELNSFHIHEVMELLSEATTPLPLIEIKKLIETKFGATAQFETCSMSGLGLTEVIDFLRSRNKLSEVAPDQFQLNIYNSCGH